MVELDGKPASNVHVHFAGPIASAREVNGQELPVGSATVQSGALVTSFTAYQPRTFALKLGAAPAKVAAVTSKPVALQYDLAAASNDDTKTAGGFDAKGDALPAEMLPSTLEFDGVEFHLAPAGTGKANAVVAKGQKLDLPAGRYNRVYVLAAADGDQKRPVPRRREDSQPHGRRLGRLHRAMGYAAVEAAAAYHPAGWPRVRWGRDASAAYASAAGLGGVGQPCHVGHRRSRIARLVADLSGGFPGYVARLISSAPISPGMLRTITRAAGLNEPYQYSYLFAYAIDLPANAHTLTLPDNANIRVLAVSVAEENPEVKPAQPLYDVLGSK